jgi:lysophospholipid acyltransferase (LPLAT)-like uncharacterized protein
MVRWTSRVEVINEDVIRRVREGFGPGIYAIWHSRLLYPAYHFGHYHPHVVISRSRDGDLIARVAERWGYYPIRGSSSRGGASAFRALLRDLQAGKDVVITPDGPRGPREKAQMGVVALARHTGYPVIPVSYDASRRIRLRSWDRFVVPLPFSRIRMVFGEPIEPEDDTEEFRDRVEVELHRTTREARNTVRPGEEVEVPSRPD